MVKKNPRLVVDIEKIRSNTRRVVERCSPLGIKVMGVTKSFCAFTPIVKAMIENGVGDLADSRIENIANMRGEGIKVPIMLLRIPMHSEVHDVVKYADMSVNSELSTVHLIDRECMSQKKKHGVVLMVDVGDLREGIWPDGVVDFAKECTSMKNIEIVGLATNYGCFGGVLPTIDNTSIMVELGRQVSDTVGHPLRMISVGGTVAYDLIERGIMPTGVNYIRIGEAISCGTDASHNAKVVEGQYQDAFCLVLEIIELKDKPSVPIGEIGCDAFNCVPVFEDRGIRKRAICALGKQDTFFEGLCPVDAGVEILGGSSDHLLLDVTESSRELKTGDEIQFKMAWGNMLRLMSSVYVKKEVINS